MAPELTDEPPARSPKRCLNCGSELSGEYCSACGQRDLPSRRALGAILREFLSETFELDGRVVRTVVPFFFRPGQLTREYLAGRRVSYTSPFRLFLAATLLWLVATMIAEQRGDYHDQVGRRYSINVQAEPAEPAAGELAATGAGDRKTERAETSDKPEHGEASRQSKPDQPRPSLGERAQRFLVEFSELSKDEQNKRLAAAEREVLPKVALALLPLFAAIVQLVYRRQRRYYVEHLVFALHIHAFTFVVLALALALPRALPIGWIAFAVVLVYLYAAMWRSYEARWWTTLLRMIALLLIYIFFASVLIVLALLFDLALAG